MHQKYTIMDNIYIWLNPDKGAFYAKLREELTKSYVLNGYFSNEDVYHMVESIWNILGVLDAFLLPGSCNNKKDIPFCGIDYPFLRLFD